MNILNSTNDVPTIRNHYYRVCYQKRNEWMVNHLSRIIVAFNGEPGKTKNTSDYANKAENNIVNINSVYISPERMYDN